MTTPSAVAPPHPPPGETACAPRLDTARSLPVDAAGMQPPENASACWHGIYVESEGSCGPVWEIERRHDGAEYRILRNLSEVPGRRPTWDAIRTRFCDAAPAMCPDRDEPRVVEHDRSFVVSHGAVSCEIGKPVVRNDYEAAAYGAIVFHMVRTGKADDEYRRRLHVRQDELAGATTRPPGTPHGDSGVSEGAR